MKRILFLLVVVALPAFSAGAGETRTVESLADKKPIAFSYYESDGGETAGVVILIHGGEAGDRLVWEKRPTNFDKKPFAEVINGDGLAVVTVDMRGHGESKAAAGGGRTNYNAMLADLESVKAFLMEQHQAKKLNIAKLGIVAADEFAPVALRYAEMDWAKPDYDDAIRPEDRTPQGKDVKAVAVLSPELSAGRLMSNTALVKLTKPNVRDDVAVMILSGKNDPQDGGAARKLAKRIRADKDQEDGYVAFAYETAFRGTDLIGQRNLPTELHLRTFLNKEVKELDIPWRDRRSKLER